MLADIWPLSRLRLRTPLVELRFMTDDKLAELGVLAAAGVHEPEQQPFTVPWTDQPVERLPQAVLQYHWSIRGDVAPDKWTIEFGVFVDGRLAGVQGISANDFRVLREVETGSWLGQAFQGRGIGTHMRAAVLDLAFNGLSATAAVSAAFTDNPSSNRVSAKLGYQPDGVRSWASRGQAATLQRLRLTRDGWAAHRTIPVEIEGLDACLPMLGAD